MENKEIIQKAKHKAEAWKNGAYDEDTKQK